MSSRVLLWCLAAPCSGCVLPCFFSGSVLGAGFFLFAGGSALRLVFAMFGSIAMRLFCSAAPRIGRGGTASCEKGYLGLFRPVLRRFAVVAIFAIPGGSVLRCCLRRLADSCSGAGFCHLRLRASAVAERPPGRRDTSAFSARRSAAPPPARYPLFSYPFLLFLCPNPIYHLSASSPCGCSEACYFLRVLTIKPVESLFLTNNRYYLIEQDSSGRDYQELRLMLSSGLFSI